MRAFELIERNGHAKRKMAASDSLEEMRAFLELKTAGGLDVEELGDDVLEEVRL